MAPYYELLENEVGLMEVENQVQLTHVAKVLIEDLHEMMYHIEHYQFVVFFFNAGSKVETGIPKG